MSLFTRRPHTSNTATPVVAAALSAPHPTDCPCLDDRSAGRQCDTCQGVGSHHTDRHDLMHAQPFPRRRHRVTFAPFTCSAPCSAAHENYVVLTYATSLADASSVAVERLLSDERAHSPVGTPVVYDVALDL